MNNTQMQLIDIYGIWYFPWYQSTKFIVSMVFLGFIVIAGFGYFLYRSGYFSKPLCFDAQALKDLADLQSRPYESLDQTRKAYFQLTMIIKHYFQVRYDLFLQDKGDQDIALIMQSKISEKLWESLVQVLQKSEQVKFAHEYVDKQHLMDDIATIRHLIEQTMSDFESKGRS